MNKYGDVQFFHDQEGGMTYALDVSFNKHDLLEAVTGIDTVFNFKLGVSFVHPNDKYNKDTGREISTQRLEALEFKFHHLHVDAEKQAHYLVFLNDLHTLRLLLRVHKNSDRPHFLAIEPFDW